MIAHRLAVLGCPIDHSLSPQMHRTWLDQLGIEGSYEAIETDGTQQGFNDVVQRLRGQGFRGANVTLPHKPHAFDLCDRVSEEARLTQTVNTLVFTTRGTVEGYNTDIEGFVKNISVHADYPASVSSGHAFFLGAGGAMRSVLLGVLQQGFVRILIANRTPARVQAMVDRFQPHFENVDFQAVDWAIWPDKVSKLPKDALLVNTTSLGMQGHDRLEPVNTWPSNLLVTDIVYNPLMTPLLAEAKQAGMSIQDGFGMLLYQGATAFSLWTGVYPEVNTNLRNKLLK